MTIYSYFAISYSLHCSFSPYLCPSLLELPVCMHSGTYYIYTSELHLSECIRISLLLATIWSCTILFLIQAESSSQCLYLIRLSVSDAFIVWIKWNCVVGENSNIKINKLNNLLISERACTGTFFLFPWWQISELKSLLLKVIQKQVRKC